MTSYRFFKMAAIESEIYVLSSSVLVTALVLECWSLCSHQMSTLRSHSTAEFFLIRNIGILRSYFQFRFWPFHRHHRRNNRRDRGRLVPQLLGRISRTMYWSPSFLAVVFKKPEILHQVVTRMQDLASEFSKIFRGWYPGPSQREGATPSRTQYPALFFGRARGASSPVLGPKPWSSLNFLSQPWLHSWSSWT